MKSKFWFLTKESLNKKLNTKSFKIVNVILLLIIVALINLDSIVKLFGGDFEDKINVYVYDNVGVYEDFKTIAESSMLNALESYNMEIKKPDKDIDALKEEMKEDETSDIIIELNPCENITNKEIFNANVISYDYIDNLLYQSITITLNTVKENLALKNANISDELLNDIYTPVNIERTILNEDLNENEEMIELIGAVIIIVFIMPIFFLIILIVQMIGAEINEEKSSKSMEIIISSVKPEVHFMSKLISANIFAITQGLLLILYVIVGVIVRSYVGPELMTTATTVVSTNEVSGIMNYINIFIHSDLASKLLIGVPFFIILIVLSFFAYSLFIGILASVTTSMEDYQQIQTPVMIFLMIGYYLAIIASGFEGSTFITAMSYIPFVSGILAPVTYTLGQLTLTGLIASIVLLAITCYLLYRYGLRVYKVGILNYSSSNLWKKIFKALKNK